MNKRLVVVTWLDAADPDRESGPWYSEDDIEEFGGSEVEVKSLGWLRSETEKYVTLCADYIINGDETVTWGRPTKVPAKMVVKIEELKVVD